MEYSLIHTLIGSIVTAFIFGMLAKKLNLPALFGYLIAGIAIGPYTPGFVADLPLAKQLAEIGIILLMFGVGLHFSLRDLWQSRKIAVPGALAQMTCATCIGMLLARLLGHSPISSLLFGFSLSVASTIVLLRTLEDRKLIHKSSGKVAISWLVVEDVAMVIALVLIPVLSEMSSSDKNPTLHDVFTPVITVALKIAGFVLFMVMIGRKFLPWLLVHIARMRSPELNTLGTLSIALGFALLAHAAFDASLALGAFLAGVMLNESEIGRKSAESSLPMRDAFSVLFFVSVGMLFNPAILVEEPVAVVLTFLIIVVAKGLVALGITHWFQQPRDTGIVVALGLAQIGEFSFILGSLALAKGLMTEDLYHLIMAGAMMSIVANPLLFRIYDRFQQRT